MSAPTSAPNLITSVRAIAEHFDLLLIDQFGVIHDGSEPFPGAADLLHWLRQQGKLVVLLTNSAKSAEVNSARLAGLGILPDVFDAVLTSGDLARRHIVAGRFAAPFRVGARVFVVGKQGDDYELERAGLQAVGPNEACDFVLFAGSSVPDVSMECYRRQLTAPASAAIPGLCCNPDLTMLTPTGPQPGCGALAGLYRELGGRILSVGKPEVTFFEEARSLFKPILRHRTLVIGDSLDHDILGGRRAGLRTALVRTGIHERLSDAALVERMTRTEAVPDFILRSLM
jgi:HAD superfamily hydrolase (TIGR01459 family)